MAYKLWPERLNNKPATWLILFQLRELCETDKLSSGYHIQTQNLLHNFASSSCYMVFFRRYSFCVSLHSLVRSYHWNPIFPHWNASSCFSRGVFLFFLSVFFRFATRNKESKKTKWENHSLFTSCVCEMFVIIDRYCVCEWMMWAARDHKYFDINFISISCWVGLPLFVSVLSLWSSSVRCVWWWFHKNWFGSCIR